MSGAGASGESSPPWRLRITGRWALSWQAYALGVAINVPLLILTGGRIGTRIVPFGDMGVLAVYGVVASILVGAWALLMNATLLRDRRVRPVALWRFVLLHSVSGAIFGVAIVLADRRLGIALDIPDALTIALTVGLGLWWGVTSAMIFEAHERFIRQRSALLDEAVMAQLALVEDSRIAATLADEARAHRVEVDGQLAAAREDLRQRISSLSALGDWLSAAQMMRSTADQTVRPLSHALWQEASRRYPEPRVAGVLSQLLREPSFLPLPAASVILIGYVSATILAYGPLLGVITAALLGVTSYAIMLGGNALMRRFRGARQLTYFATVSALEAATLILAYGPARVDGVGVPASLIAGALLGTLVSILLTSVVASLDASRASVIAQLSSTVNSERLAQLARSRTRSLALRELAKELHGTVQTRLIACASAMELAAREGNAQGCLESLRESVRVLDDLDRGQEGTLASTLTSLARSWDPMCQVHVDIAPPLASAPHPDVSRIVEEAIGNAYRHGGAGRVDVSVAPVDGGIRIEVTDDGTGPVGGPPGLGTDVLARATRGNFELRAAPGGGAVLSAILPMAD
jgi:signal transduction histidine kinase